MNGLTEALSALLAFNLAMDIVLLTIRENKKKPYKFSTFNMFSYCACISFVLAQVV